MSILSKIDARTIFLILVVLASIFEVAGDYLFKKWSISNNHSLILLGLGIYFIGSLIWAVSLKFETLSKGIAIFFILNLIIAVFIGIIIFGDKLTILNKFGILLGIASIILIEFY